MWRFSAGPFSVNLKLLLLFMHFSSTRVDAHYLLISSSVDILNTIILLVSYVGPLLQIMNSLMQQFNGKLYSYNGKDLLNPVLEISIIISVATASSVIAHVISVYTETYIVFAIDIPINMSCAMLLAPFYGDGAYQRVCCGLIYTVETCNECCSGKWKAIDIVEDENNEKAETSKSTNTRAMESTTFKHDTICNTKTMQEPATLKKYVSEETVTHLRLIESSQLLEHTATDGKGYVSRDEETSKLEIGNQRDQ